jgi:elongation factor Tu
MTRSIPLPTTLILCSALWASCLGALASESDAPETYGPETYAPETDHQAASDDFEMAVMDVFNITGKGVVATGQVSQGSISVGDLVCLSNGQSATVEGIEMFRKVLDSLGPGDSGGLLLGGLSKDDVEKGEVISSCR